MMKSVWWGLAAPLLLTAAQPELPGWKPFKPKDGSFTVVVPGMASETTQKVNTKSATLRVTKCVADGPGDSLLVVSYSDYPEAELKKGDIEQRLDNLRDAAITRTDGKLRREKTIDLGGNPGRDIEIEKGGAVMVRMRIFVVRRRLYQVMVLGSGAAFPTKEAEIFLDSFRLNK